MPTYYKGRIEPRNLSHLIALSHARHGHRLRLMRSITAPPATWDSVARGWVPPVQDQGQCHDDQTEVLTEDGWKYWKDYDGNTALGTMNQCTGFLEFQIPISQQRIKHDGEMYYTDHRGMDFAVTPNHRMYINKYIRNTDGFSSDLSFAPICEVGHRFKLPNATKGWAGVELKELMIGRRSYSGDDFVALIALILSDGHIRNTYGHENGIGFCCYRNDRREMVQNLAYRLGISEESFVGRWSWTDGGLAKWIRQNCFIQSESIDRFRAPYKRIPRIIKCCSQRQINLFLEFFGDQNVEKGNNRRSFYSSSKTMIDDLQELLLMTGKCGTITSRDPRSAVSSDGREFNSKHESFEIREKINDGFLVRRYNDLHKDYYKGEVYCATVPNGTLVTRRNGRVLISGNCGSCWCFSGTGVCDVAYMVAGIGTPGQPWLFSEQYTLSCGRNGACQGDDNTNVLDWAKSTGLPLQSTYGPYDARAESCKWSSSMQLYKIDDWGFADSNGGQGVTPAADIKAAIMQYGAVGCAVAADDSFSNYQSGTVFGKTTSRSIDHDVMLVGWDDTKSTVSGKTVWKMRNSWGTSWGNSGYMWILEGVNLIGTESVWAVVHNPTPPLPPFVRPTP